MNIGKTVFFGENTLALKVKLLKTLKMPTFKISKQFTTNSKRYRFDNVIKIFINYFSKNLLKLFTYHSVRSQHFDRAQCSDKARTKYSSPTSGRWYTVFACNVFYTPWKVNRKCMNKTSQS